MTPLPRMRIFMARPSLGATCCSRPTSSDGRGFVNGDAMETLAERGQYLVTDRAGEGGKVIDGAVPADQFDQIAGLQTARRQCRDVEDDAVHRHAAGERKLDAIAPGRGRSTAWQAVGIAE